MAICAHPFLCWQPLAFSPSQDLLNTGGLPGVHYVSRGPGQALCGMNPTVKRHSHQHVWFLLSRCSWEICPWRVMRFPSPPAPHGCSVGPKPFPGQHPQSSCVLACKWCVGTIHWVLPFHCPGDWWKPTLWCCFHRTFGGLLWASQSVLFFYEVIIFYEVSFSYWF